jgi:hypothetical protein
MICQPAASDFEIVRNPRATLLEAGHGGTLPDGTGIVLY